MVTLLRVAYNTFVHRPPAVCARTFSTCLPLRSTAESSSTAQQKGARRTATKKSYSELPTARLTPDGKLAAPLEDWDGGLEERFAVNRASTRAHSLRPDINSAESSSRAPESDEMTLDNEGLSADAAEEMDIQAVDESSADGLESPSVPKRRPKKKSQLNADEAELNGHAEDATPVKKKKRKPRDTSTTKDETGTAKKKVKKVKKRESSGDESAVDEEDPYRPRLAKEILANLRKFPHCILLTRVGQFWESYFDQAKEVSRLLGIKLTSRTMGTQIPMCGFPLAHLDKHLKNIIQNHKRFVALCEEFPPDPKAGPNAGFDRRVTRIITPGTLIDESFLNPYEDNYLLSIAYFGSTSYDPTDVRHRQIGLAWIDVSTGEFFTKASMLDELRDELVRISPREIILSQDYTLEDSHPIRRTITEEGFFASYISPSKSAKTDPSEYNLRDNSGADDVTTHIGTSVPQSDIVLSDYEVYAVRLLTSFLQSNLMENMPTLPRPSRESAEGRMQIDSHTIRALEIREGLNDGGATGTLLSVIKRTVTTSGTRLLARWLCSPSTSLKEIQARQSLVAFFHARPYLCEDLVQLLTDIEDASRIVQRFLLGRGQVNDLSAICNTIRAWTKIEDRIELEKEMEKRERGSIQVDDWSSIDALMRGLHDISRLVNIIEDALTAAARVGNSVGDDDAPAEEERSPNARSLPTRYSIVKNRLQSLGEESWSIKPGFTEELRAYHTTLKELLERREQLQKQLQTLYDSKTLSLRLSPTHGLHVHVANTKRDSKKLKASPEFIFVSENGSTSSFQYKDWTSLGTQLIDTILAISTAERRTFEILRNEVTAVSTQLRHNARIVDELDATVAFANLASEMKFVRPNVTEGTSFHVVNGRHPTVELGLLTSGRVFTPNTVLFTPESRLHIITGPNMAGKSTLLRQNALIAVLAQTGSFVPADYAEIGIVDRVFSRIGARDDLFRDRSTFMVEMLETSEILQRATPNSLVIMDEVGRGTTVDDGIAIAFAAVHHLLTVNGCRAMFATHFHELADMLGCTNDSKGRGSFAGASFFCTDVNETEDGYFSYSHRLQPGVNRNSHGLKVAQLAGLPQPAIAVAKSALSWLKSHKNEVRTAHNLQVLGQSLASQ